MKAPPVPPTDLEALKRQQRAFYQANAKYYHLIDEQVQSGYTYDDILKELAGRLTAPVRFLDVGCGSGYYVLRAREIGCVATGIDLSLHSCHMGSRRVDGRFCQADAESLPFRDGCFGLVFCQQLIEHVVFPERVLAEIARVLRPGGVLFLSAPNRLGRGSLPKVRRILRELYAGTEVKRIVALSPDVLRRWKASDDIDALQDTDLCNETTVFQALRLLQKVGLRMERFDTLRHPRKYSRHAYLIARIAGKIPLLRYGGVNFKIVARKPGDT
jgi:ubiquinone/menaquinone biosynthesis C-methylase UbiE